MIITSNLTNFFFFIVVDKRSRDQATGNGRTVFPTGSNKFVMYHYHFINHRCCYNSGTNQSEISIEVKQGNTVVRYLPVPVNPPADEQLTINDTKSTSCSSR